VTAVVWLAWVCWYLFGLSPSLGGEDSGEFATVAATLGISHAPGYPLYALAGRLCAAFPVGSVAFRLNLLSAATAAGACALLFRLAGREARARFGAGPAAAAACGAVASLAVGLTGACWYQAAISDKYAVALLAFAVLTGGMISGWRWPFLALALGVSFAHHLQTLYVLPGLAWIAWRIDRPSPRTLAVCAVLFVAGLSPKLEYPPIRAAEGPALMIDRPVTWARQLDYLRARTYASKVAGPSAASRWSDALGELASQASPGLPGIGIAVGLAGLTAWALAGGPASLIWLTAATGLVFAASLDITGREFYLLPVVWCLAFGVGMTAAAAGAPRWRALKAPLGAAAALLPLLLAVQNRHALSRNRLSLELDYGRNLLAGLPPRAVFFESGDDIIYPIFYLQIVEGFRSDVVAIPEGFLSRAFTRARLARALPGLEVLGRPAWPETEEESSRAVAAAALRAGRAVALTSPSREGISQGLRREIRDLVYEVFRDRSAMRPGRALWMRTRGWGHDPRGLTIRQGWILSLYGKYQRQYADALANGGRVAQALPRHARALAVPDLPDREGAANNYALALDRAGRPAEAVAVWGRLMAAGSRRPEVYLNAGNILLATGRREEARRAFEAALARSGPSSAYAAYARRQLARLSREP